MINERLKRIFLDLIQIEGISGKEKDVAGYICDFLKNLGLNVTIDNTQNITKSNTGNVICKLGNGGNFVLACHMDTSRSTKNVKPIFHKDRITSNGDTVLGVDNRAGIAILLFLVEKISNEKIDVHDFTLVCNTTEETSLGGSKSLQLNSAIKMGFVFDSYLRPGSFVDSSSGAASFDITIHGKAVHSGIEPEKGINSLLISVQAINKLSFGKVDDVSTINIGLLNSGSAVNVVPEITTLQGEIRSDTAEHVEKHIQHIKDTFEKTADEHKGKIDFNWRWDFKPYHIKPESEIFKKISGSITNAGLKPLAARSMGGSDANSLNEKGIRSVNIGIGAQNPHSNDEFIFYEDFNNAFQIAYELVKK